jgi:hypothetical protein
MISKWICLSLLVTILGLYALSLALPALQIHSEPGDGQSRWVSGLPLLVIGPLAILGGQVGWLANACFGLNVVLVVWKKRASLIIAIAAIVLSLQTYFTFRHFYGDVDEYVDRFGSGFYVWLASIALTLPCALLTKVPGRAKGVTEDASI